MVKALIWKDILHPIATVVGAWGGFPKPPIFFKKLAQYEIFQWFLVFLLAYQGGADEDLAQAFAVTIGLYLITKILKLGESAMAQQGIISQQGTISQQATPSPPPPPPPPPPSPSPQVPEVVIPNEPVSNGTENAMPANAAETGVESFWSFRN